MAVTDAAIMIANRKAFVGKKGVFMTLMALAVIIFLFAYSEILEPSTVVQNADAHAERTRVIVMNSYIDTLERHTADSLQIAGYLALQNLSERIRENKTNITTTQQLNNLLYQCIWSNASLCTIANPSSNKSLAYAIRNMTALALNGLNINTIFNITNITINDSAPFEVMFTATITYNISDAGSGTGFASWESNSTISTSIDVQGVLDPLYMYGYRNGTFIGTAGTRTFNKAPYRKSQLNDTAFTANPKGFYYSRMYIASISRGPSVVQRYIMNWTGQSACCGIESVIQFTELNNTIQSDKQLLANLSLADHLFMKRTLFDCTRGQVVGLKNLTGIHQSARIDRYGLENIYNYYNNASDPTIYYITACLS